MDIAKLKADMPAMAARLGEMMATDGLGAYEAGIMTLDEATPSVSIGYTAKDGKHFKLTLSFDWATAKEVADAQEEC